MHNLRWFPAIVLVYFLLFFSHAMLLKKTVYGDGIFYYSWVRSVVVDHDINFANEYARFGVQSPGNKYPIGAPIFWLPWYAWFHAVVGGDGYSLSYQLLTGIVSVIASIAGLVFLRRLLMQSFSPTASTLATMSIALTTNLPFYGAVDPVNSHAVSFFAAAVFLSFLLSKKVSPFLTGCALGFCALVRPQDAAFGILTLPSLKGSHPLRLTAGLLIVFSPQLLAWYALYGSAWTSPYLTSGESFTWGSAHLVDVLFSPTNGLFLWTPVTLLALAGLFIWKNPMRVWFLFFFTAEAAIVGSWSTWWQGASYSGRMFVSSLPVLSFGLASLFSKLADYRLRAQQILLAIIGPLAVINVLLIVRFLLKT